MGSHVLAASSHGTPDHHHPASTGSLARQPGTPALPQRACAGYLPGRRRNALRTLRVRGRAAVFPPELWGHSAAAGLARLTPVGVFLAAVIYAPVVETVLGQVLPIEAAHRLGAPPLACVLLSALVFACGHYLNGGLAHGTTSFFSGMLFACAYVNMRWAGIAPAVLAAATAHAVQNVTVLFLIGPLFPAWA